MDLDVFILPNSVGSIGRLIFDGGIPPAIEVEDVRGGGEIEPCAACFER